MKDILILFLIFIGTIIFIWGIARDSKKCELVLKKWADKNDLQIIKRRHPYPWELLFYKACKAQPKFIITAIDSSGHTKKGHVIFGTCFRGVYTKKDEEIKAQVTWYI